MGPIEFFRERIWGPLDAAFNPGLDGDPERIAKLQRGLGVPAIAEQVTSVPVDDLTIDEIT